MAEWKARVVESGEASPDDLLPNPLNWRLHPAVQADALEQALDQVGWVQTVLVNKTTGHLVDGHLRVALAQERGLESIPVSYVELDEAEERIVLASLDPLSALAVSDDSALMGLLSDIAGNEDFVPMIEWLRDRGTAAPRPSQSSIDQHQQELEDRFRNGPDGTGIEVKCPECGMEFGLAGIGITS